MIKSIRAITISSYVAMLFLGVASTVVGAAARNIGLTPSQIGLILAAQNLGFAVSVLISGAMADTQPKPRILTIGSLVLAVSFLTFYLSPVFWVNIVIMFLIGIGVGTYEGTTDAMLFDLHTSRAALYINVNHFFVTLGAALITLYLIFLEMNWRVSVVQSGIAVLLLAAFFAIAELRPMRGLTTTLGERLRILARSSMVARLFLATALVVGVELGSIGILTTYLVDLRGMTQLTSKLGLLTMLAGMGTGRLVVGFLVKPRRVPQVILTLFALATLLFTVLYFVDAGSLVFVAAFLAGLALSALLPLMLTLAGTMFSEMPGTALGSIKVAIPVGGIMAPLAMALVATRVSFQASLAVLPLSLLVAALVLLPLRRM